MSAHAGQTVLKWARVVFIILRTKRAISTPIIRHYSKLGSLQSNIGCHTVPVSTSSYFTAFKSTMAEQVPSLEQAETPGQGQTAEDVEMIQDSGDLPSSSDVPPEQEVPTQQSQSETQTSEQVQSPPDEQTQKSSKQAQHEEPQDQQQDEVNKTDESKDKQGEKDEEGMTQDGTKTKVGDIGGDQQNVSKAGTKKTTALDGSSNLFRYFQAPFKRWFSTESGPKRDRAYYEGLTLEEKRKQYTCDAKYVTLESIPTWEEDVRKVPKFTETLMTLVCPNQDLNQALIRKVSLWRGDITSLEIDAIVNAANSSLLGGGGVDGAIHRAASYSLRDECATLGGCNSGDAKLSSGHRLPAKYILHTVGPMNGSETKLKSCYTTCLQLVLQHNIRSVAFCCIATGVYGFPNVDAAHIALAVTRNWLEMEDNADKVDRIIFCVFLKQDFEIYKKLLQCYFPLEEEPVDPSVSSEQPSHENTAESTLNTDGKEETSEGSCDKMEDVPTLRKAVTEPAPSTSTKQTVATDEQLSNNTTQVEVESPPPPAAAPVEDKEEEQMETDQEKETKEDKQDSKRPKTETPDEPNMGIQ